MTAVTPPKVADELAAQRFQMLEDMAKELEGDVLFPTCFDLVVTLRNLMKDPDVSIDKVTAAVSVDPLICSKLLALANSAAYSAHQPLREVKGAIQRLGLTVVRTTSLAIALRQMLMLGGIAGFAEMARQLWMHSLLSASASFVVAHRLTTIHPDEAYMAGLVHDIGAFYMLYRATQYPELVARPESLKYLVMQWHEGVGQTLMSALHFPDDVVEAMRDHDCLHDAPQLPRNLADVIYLGNVLAGSHFEWSRQDVDRETIARFPLGPQYTDLMDEIRQHAASMAIAVT